jgi:hypothetical protein
MKPSHKHALIVCGLEGLASLVGMAVMWDLEGYDATKPLVALVIVWVVTWWVVTWYFK